MKRNFLIPLFVFVFTIQFVFSADPIKIACVGNSITEAANIKDGGYTGLLQEYLGEDYKVYNFGLSGATALKGTYLPYDKSEHFKQAMESEPDIVTIALGTNDSQSRVWNDTALSKNFERDYRWLCEQFTHLPSKPVIYVCFPPAVFPSEKWEHQDAVIRNEIIPTIRKIAVENGYEMIDLHSLFVDKENLLPDKLHPNYEGHKIMAKEFYRIISEK